MTPGPSPISSVSPVKSQVHLYAHRRKITGLQSNVLWTEGRTLHLRQEAATSDCLPQNERSLPHTQLVVDTLARLGWLVIQPNSEHIPPKELFSWG